MNNIDSKKPKATLSLDLDNTWSYLKIHGNQEWERYPSHFPLFIPLILDFLDKQDQKITFFIVGKDASIKENHPWLRKIADCGHEVANHSFHHEPWMEQWTENQVYEELLSADTAIHSATGKSPVGFRGPGFCHSAEMLRAIKRMNYPFDASVLATSIAPLARLYYFWKMDKGSLGALGSPGTLKASRTLGPTEEKEKRKNLFGGFSRVFLPNSPFYWVDSRLGNLLEIPVTTIPLIRTPFHLSYLIWLGQFSERLAMTYLRTAIHLCKLFRVTPSFLLHPPDFFGGEDVPALSFFPGMNLSRQHKLKFAHKVIDELQCHYELVPMSHWADLGSTEKELKI